MGGETDCPDGWTVFILSPHSNSSGVAAFQASASAGFIDINETFSSKMSATIVPLISSSVAGPLGVLHLPRLWLKASLEAAGKLAAGYPGIGQGYDMMVITGLGLNADAVRKFITDSKPTYPQFEAWIRSQPGVNLSKGNIHKLNVSIAGYIHNDDVRKGILAANNLPDNGSVLPDAINLNNLDDWYEFHQAVLK
jgi:hypothetical protein